MSNDDARAIDLSWSRSCFGELLIVASKSRSEAFADYADQVDTKRLVFGQAVCVVDFYKVTGDEGDYAWHVRNALITARKAVPSSH